MSRGTVLGREWVDMGMGREDDGMNTALRCGEEGATFSTAYVGYTLPESYLGSLCSVASYGWTSTVVRAGSLIQCPGDVGLVLPRCCDFF